MFMGNGSECISISIADKVWAKNIGKKIRYEKNNENNGGHPVPGDGCGYSDDMHGTARRMGVGVFYELSFWWWSS